MKFRKPSSLILLIAAASEPALSQDLDCLPPVRPYVPSEPHDVEAYKGLIRQDFETYIADFEAYLRCLDDERARVFAEGQEVTAEYGRFQALTGRLGPAPGQ